MGPIDSVHNCDYSNYERAHCAARHFFLSFSRLSTLQNVVLVKIRLKMQELVELADTVGRSEKEVLIRKSFATAIREYKKVLPKQL